MMDPVVVRPNVYVESEPPPETQIIAALRARTDLAEILRTTQPRFTEREILMLRAICIPDHKESKQMAADLKLSPDSVKVYFSRLYRKLGWPYGSHRMLVLYAIAHRQELGIAIPTPAEFQHDSRVALGEWPDVQKGAEEKGKVGQTETVSPGHKKHK